MHAAATAAAGIVDQYVECAVKGEGLLDNSHWRLAALEIAEHDVGGATGTANPVRDLIDQFARRARVEYDAWRRRRPAGARSPRRSRATSR